MLRPLTGKGSGLLIAAVVGGAFVPLAQGALADRIGIHHRPSPCADCAGAVLYLCRLLRLCRLQADGRRDGVSISLVKRCGLLLLAVAGLAGCARPAALPPDTRLPGVTANSGGDTRGTILYQPGPPPAVPARPYAALSDRFVIGQRQQMAAALTQIDTQAHAQAAARYPVPAPGTPRYSKPFASVRAQQQAQLNTRLLEQGRTRFCSQYHVTYDGCLLILQEAREKHWPVPPPKP